MGGRQGTFPPSKPRLLLAACQIVWLVVTATRLMQCRWSPSEGWKYPNLATGTSVSGTLPILDPSALTSSLALLCNSLYPDSDHTCFCGSTRGKGFYDHDPEEEQKSPNRPRSVNFRELFMLCWPIRAENEIPSVRAGAKSCNDCRVTQTIPPCGRVPHEDALASAWLGFPALKPAFNMEKSGFQISLIPLSMLFVLEESHASPH